MKVATQVKVYIEGYAVPASSVVVSFGTNTPATCNIAVFPAAEVKQLKPRSLVEVYYYDDKAEKYRLLFLGEIVAVGLTTTPTGKQATISCIDVSSYWDTARIFFYGFLEDLFDPTRKIMAKFAGAKRGPTDIVFGSAAAIRRILRQDSEMFPGTKGVLNKIMRLIETLGGLKDAMRQTSGINDFFTIAQYRRRICEQIAVPEDDTTPEQLMNSKEFHQYLESIAAGGGALTTLRDVLLGLLNVIKFNMISNPCATAHFEEVYVKPKKGGKKKKTKGKTKTTYSVERLNTIIFAPDIFYGMPPACNVIFPEYIRTYTFTRDYLACPTRLMMTVPVNFLQAPDVGSALIGKLFYFVPNIPDISGQPFKKLARKAVMTLLPHEVFTGPIPTYETFQDIREYDPILAFSGASIAKKIHKTQAAHLQKARGITDPIPYLEHVANWMFTVSRYATRQIVVPMIFNPYIVAGFPVLILSPNPTEIKHILAVPARVTHTITPGGAETVIQCTMAREYNEDDEIYQAKTRKVVGYRTKKATRKEKVFVPAGQKIEDVLQKDGSKQTAIVEKKELGKDQKGAVYEVTYSYQYKEPITKMQGTKLPFEDQVRPPWVSTLYMNDRIDEFYTKLLGCHAAHIEFGLDPKTSVKDAVEAIYKIYTAKVEAKNVESLFTHTERNIATMEEVAQFIECAHVPELDIIGTKLPIELNSKRCLKIVPEADPTLLRKKAAFDYFIAVETIRNKSINIVQEAPAVSFTTTSKKPT